MLRPLLACGRAIRRHPWRSAFVVLILALTPTAYIIVARTWWTPHADQRPLPTAGPMTAEVQVAPDTCGLHALNTVYRAYGLDPAAENLRARLGVDIQALVWLGDSTGVLHPDIYMVLAQDHFRSESVDIASPTAWGDLRRHLDSGHPALMLVHRRETDGLHWVVASETRPDSIVILDSLATDPAEETAAYLGERVVSILLIRPSTPAAPPRSAVSALASGAHELVRSTPRL